MNGKGSKPRPMQISREEYSRRYDMAFGTKKDTLFICAGCAEVNTIDVAANTVWIHPQRCQVCGAMTTVTEVEKPKP